LTDAVTILARFGQSFRLAGRLLPSSTLADAAELYAFCRGVDDLADECVDPGAARAELLLLRDAVLAGDDGHPMAARFLALQRRCGLDPSAAITLIETVLSDLDPVRVEDEAELLRYAYGAAGTVGLMMCPILDARGAAATTYAIDLGIAMQLTNIARDVAEDAKRGRLYLPATWLPTDLGVARLHEAPNAVFSAVKLLLDRADCRYRSAELGYSYLPPRVRPAIRAAARIYEEIGRRILHHGPDYLDAGRCIVPMPRKLFLLAGSLVAAPMRSGPDLVPRDSRL